MYLSMSDISSFLKCRRKWLWESPNGRNLVPLGLPPDYFWLGTGIHVALERWYDPRQDQQKPLVDWFLEWLDLPEQQAALTDSFEHNRFEKSARLGLAMCQGYVLEYGDRPEDDPEEFRVLTCEQEFVVPIPETSGFLVGTMDGLILKDGELWVIDHKTYSYAPTDEVLQLNSQFQGYAWAARRIVENGALAHLGVTSDVPVRGTLWNGLRKQMPGPNVRQPLFARAWLPYPDATFYEFEQYLAHLHADMLDPACYHNPTRDCKDCDFQQPCVQVQLGADFEHTLQTEFKTATPRGEVYALIHSARGGD